MSVAFKEAARLSRTRPSVAQGYLGTYPAPKGVVGLLADNVSHLITPSVCLNGTIA
jgi:hypothetical protein